MEHAFPIKGLKHTVHGEAPCYVPLHACTGLMWLCLSTKTLLRASSLVVCVWSRAAHGHWPYREIA